MPVSQLVVRTSGGTESLEAVHNDQQQPPREFEDNNTRVPEIGSDKLIEMAFALKKFGYSVTDLSLVDYTFTVLEDEIAAAYKLSLIDHLRSEDEEALWAFVRGRMLGFYVLNLELRQQITEPHIRVTIVQDGIIFTTAQGHMEEFYSTLLNAIPWGFWG
jgi:hypothetical protein